MTSELATPTQTGTLVVRYSSGSYFLSQNMPIEIRDRSHRLVGVVTGAESRINLEPGLYSVTAVLENGLRNSYVVKVQAAKHVSIELAVPSDELFGVRSIAGGRRLEPLNDLSAEEIVSQPRGLHRTRREESEIIPGTHLFAMAYGLQIEAEPEGLLTVTRHGDAEGLSWLAVMRDCVVTLLALPLSGNNAETRSCTVRVDPRHDSLRVELLPGRRVTKTLQGMLAAGDVSAAFELADKGSELLAAKYSDPVAAAFGGLLLQRFDALSRHTSWVENLAHDFAWLPDAHILLAAVRGRDRGGEALLAGTNAPFTVFSDAFSLALSLLRRWDSSAHAQRLESLSQYVLAHFDFNTTYSTLRWKL